MLNPKFRELISLQSKREEIEEEANKIQKVSPMCQLPKPFFEALDKVGRIGERQAEIWNEIRGFILKNNKETIWQLAIKNNFPVRGFGQEHFLKLNSSELNLIQMQLK